MKMSTRCMIFKKKRSWGKTKKSGYLGIYCHNDGYPQGVGKILKKHYKTDEKIDKLIALGDISSLGSRIGEKHDFDAELTLITEDWTRAYHRDRGEAWSDVKPVFVTSIQDMRNSCEWCGYIYVYENSKWTYFEV